MESNKAENEILKKHANSLDERLVLKMDEEAPLHYAPPPPSLAAKILQLFRKALRL